MDKHALENLLEQLTTILNKLKNYNILEKFILIIYNDYNFYGIYINKKHLYYIS